MRRDFPGTKSGRARSPFWGGGLAALCVMLASGEAAASQPHAQLLTPGAAAFYTGAVTIIGAFFLINFSLKNWVGALYAALFAAMLGVIWSLEGGPALLWADLSTRGLQAFGASAGLAASALGFYTAERAIDPREPLPRLRSALRYGVWGSLGLILPVWLWPFGPLAHLVNFVIVMMFAAQFLSARTWRNLSDTHQKLPALITLMLVVVSVILIVITNSGATLDEAGRAHLMRGVFALITAPTMAAIVLALIDIRRSRDAALARALETARRDAERSAALLELEKNYTAAREIAAKRSRQLSTAFHDIRQPIASLRAELDALRGDIVATNADRLDRILDHFDALTNDLSGEAQAPTPDTENETPEPVPARLLFATLERMFAAEAAAKGVSLRFVGSNANFHAPAIVLMRISTNLIANALAHSGATKILVGLRLNASHARLLIMDNGCGLPDRPDLFAPGAKSDASAGSGLGLSIIRELSNAHGFDLKWTSHEQRGSSFSLTIPRAQP